MHKNSLKYTCTYLALVSLGNVSKCFKYIQISSCRFWSLAMTIMVANHPLFYIYVQLQSDSSLGREIWFHGNLSRKEAEKALEEDGDFLVRSRSNIFGELVLSCKTKKGYEHFILRRKNKSHVRFLKMKTIEFIVVW